MKQLSCNNHMNYMYVTATTLLYKQENERVNKRWKEQLGERVNKRWKEQLGERVNTLKQESKETNAQKKRRSK